MKSTCAGILRFFHREKKASPFISVGSMNLFTVIYKKELMLKYINHLKEEDITYRQLNVHIMHDPVVVEAEMEVRLFVEVAHAFHVHHLEE